MSGVKVRVHKGGPYQVEGEVRLVDAETGEEKVEKDAWLCRCGKSGKKPFCDGAHKVEKFDEATST